jgi:NTP pyrophosphatase (non-canonical NTP hydrolase)
MKDLLCDEFQNVVGDLLIRHRSILDILSMLSESSSRVNRAITKSITECGCLAVETNKPVFPAHLESFEDLKQYLDSHLKGNLCSNCEEIIYNELGKLLFYTTALCSTLDISLYDVFIKEYKKSCTLGIFNLT